MVKGRLMGDNVIVTAAVAYGLLVVIAVMWLWIRDQFGDWE